MDIEELYDKVYDALEDGSHDSDIALGAAIELELLSLLSPKLDGEQKSAVDCARRFWLGEAGEEERIGSLKTASARIDTDLESGSDQTAEGSIRRLVFSSLTNNTGLSYQLAEFLIGLAEDAGLSADEIVGAFSQHLPLSK